MFDIESNIPLPVRAKRGSSYPFAKMAVGDSFFVGTADEAEDKRATARLSAAIRVFRKGSEANGARRFAVCTVQEGDKAGVRVWRTA